MSIGEKSYKIGEKAEIELSCQPYILTDKIRTNKEIASFIKQLFNVNVNIPNKVYPNIKLLYCRNYVSAKVLLQNLAENGWKVPNYTPGTRTLFYYENYKSDDPDCAHSVIGQEFDNVAIAIDDYFTYDSTGQLVASNKYYSQKQMLYQIITRTRKKLCVVIINNEMMLNRCIDILNR